MRTTHAKVEICYPAGNCVVRKFPIGVNVHPGNRAVRHLAGSTRAFTDSKVVLDPLSRIPVELRICLFRASLEQTSRHPGRREIRIGE